MTPPVAPKMTPAPLYTPMGESKPSSGMSSGCSRSARTRRTSSRVVSTRSTSRPASVRMVGRSHSDFLATQGMMETLKILSGSTPMRLAKQALATAPNICWGLLAVESRSVHSG